ncbi:hypothetical protein [Candidatus Poriferisodalis sp.]|uniref:hypothetical protein n=1 Tax=Candidatus Poriferisodalis sp. TaxID=3101277 RepID=UPI003B02D05A
MRRRWLLIVCAAATLSVIAAVVAATRVDGAKTVRVGVAVTYSGVGAALGTEVERGIELFIEQNPGAFGGHAVELVKADLKRPDGEAVPAALRALLDPGGGGG